MSWQESYDENFLDALRKAVNDEKLLDMFLSRKISLYDLAKSLGWKSFEELTAFIFSSMGYSVLKNFRLKRREIDVLAYNEKLAFAVDCKHWKRMPPSALELAVRKQKERAKALLESLDFSKKVVIPVIVTLYESSLKLIDGTPLVPIFKMTDFINNIYGYLGYLETYGPVAQPG